jgi:hypothetical protein
MDEPDTIDNFISAMIDAPVPFDNYSEPVQPFVIVPAAPANP